MQIELIDNIVYRLEVNKIIFKKKKNLQKETIDNAKIDLNFIKIEEREVIISRLSKMYKYLLKIKIKKNSKF